MPDTHPNASIDLQQISTRNEHARHIVAGFAALCRRSADMWRSRRRAHRHRRSLGARRAAFRRA